MTIFKQQFLVSLSAGNTISKFKRREKLQNFTGFRGFPQICNIFPILPNMQHFPNHWSMQIFLTSGIGLDILMKVFEGYIILLLKATLYSCLLFNIYLKQKQGFSVWSFAEITSFISFHEGILSIIKNTKKCRFQPGNLLSITKTKNRS